MTEPEFPHWIDLRQVPESVVLRPTAVQRAALARRFGITEIKAMEAELALDKQGADVAVEGRLRAEVIQPCAVSGEDFAVEIDEPLEFRFVPARPARHDEIELAAEECDEIEFEGHQFDLGEAVAQSLALAIDPFAEGPGAEEARRTAGLADPPASGAFAALAALRKEH